MKHCKLEYDDATYEVIREAAYRDRLPIRQWVAKVAAEAASEQTGLPLPDASPPATEQDKARRAHP